MPASLHRHPHSGKDRRVMQNGEPAHEAIADSAKRLLLRASSALQAPTMAGDSTLELGVCLGHYHPTTTLVR
jgi:hypothetical protein